MTFDFDLDVEDRWDDDDRAYGHWVDSGMGELSDSEIELEMMAYFAETQADDLVIPGCLPENHVPGQIEIFEMLFPNEEDIPFS